MYAASKDKRGNTNINYKLKLYKKSEDVSFEEYRFDKNLKFLDNKDAKERKIKKADYKHSA